MCVCVCVCDERYFSLGAMFYYVMVARHISNERTIVLSSIDFQFDNDQPRIVCGRTAGSLNLLRLDSATPKVGNLHKTTAEPGDVSSTAPHIYINRNHLEPGK